VYAGVTSSGLIPSNFDVGLQAVEHLLPVRAELLGLRLVVAAVLG